MVKSGETPLFDGVISTAGTSIEAPQGVLKIGAQVLSESGETLDRFSILAEVPEQPTSGLFLGTPLVSVARTPVEVRAVLASQSPPIHAGREFVRTDRLIVRTTVYGPEAAAAAVTATLLDKRGTVLVKLLVTQSSGGSDYQIDLPLASIAAGQFVVAIAAANGDARAEAFVPIRVVR